MSQPPNPPGGPTPGQPEGWPGQPAGGDSGWGSDPTLPLPAGQQYPPTQPLPAGQQYPPTQPFGSPANPYPGAGPARPYPPGSQPGAPGFGQNPVGSGPQYAAPGPYAPNAAGGQYAPGQYGPPGPYGPGQYGPGQYGPPGGGGAPPPGGAGSGRNRGPMILGIVAAVAVIGLLAWFLIPRQSGSAAPSPTVDVPSVSAQPSVLTSPLITPSAAPSPDSSEPDSSEFPTPSASASPESTGSSADCSDKLNTTQCDWAVFLGRFVVISTCAPDASDPRREAFACAANSRGEIDGNATVTMRWADDSADLTTLMNQFFTRAGIGKSKIGDNWKSPPALTNWWYTDKPKEVLGKLGSADADDGSGRVAWTYRKQRFFIEARSESDNARTMIDWWAGG